MMNNKKIKKAVASILTCAMTCTLLPASESFAARNNKETNEGTPSVITGGAVSTRKPETVSHGAIDAEKPSRENAENKNQRPVTTGGAADAVSNGAVNASTNKKEKAKIKVSKTNKKVKKGKKYKITYSVVSGSGKVTFKSSNKKVATVSAKGIVTAKKKGKATITVKIANGNSKKVKITVK